ncbi:glycerol 3-phosphate dehydrogenase (NAD(P)+) [Alteribacillus persepolensis]|uniref:Glycerol-3-phosphate dehydrogenase [NAD(P)+] n=1 Tax=Alteribacillus persepolensis TaxID=568899 RepID=A0A1G7ZHF7_9BACI|nr:NAD(P)H-dependent glycerol-3-phosphate dehydrogenase [Alteribacillus persepolensis]SDH08069.1 glycerol 3-phosphate dehydrogenase (NAD(P)+) [Alteribacillus persepolensis]
MKQNIMVAGAGSWGTALAAVLADNGHQVKIWTRRQEQASEINHSHTNEAYLPGFSLPSSIQASTDIRVCAEGTQYILLVVPTKAIRDTMKRLKPFIQKHHILIHASKGIEPGTSKRISEMMDEELNDEQGRATVVLSGPSHAEEVCEKQPTTITASSHVIDAASEVQELLMNQHFRVYTNEDLIGVEMGGALKNVIALGIGLTDGLGYGDNAKAALMTRGLAEIARLGIKLGANPLTFTGLSGLGDLIVTCTSKHSRNWRAGYKLGTGKELDAVLEEMNMVVEGVRTTKAVHELSKQLDVEMPITEALFHVLFEGKDPKEAANQLMGRVKKHEVENVSLLLGHEFHEKWQECSE